MEEMDDKDKRLQIEDRNHEQLLDEVESLVVGLVIFPSLMLIEKLVRFQSKLDIGPEAEELLRRGDLSNSQSLSKCTMAALALQQAVDAGLSPGYS